MIKSARVTCHRILFGALLFNLMQPLHAAVLGLTPSFPDFSLSTNQIFTYDANCDTTYIGDCSAGQGKLTITGTVGTYTEVGPGGLIEGAPVDQSAFSLTAILDISGASVVSGSFFLNGRVLDLSNFPPPAVYYDGADHPSGNLLNGDLNQFGFAGSLAPATGGIMEFTFGNAGGYIADPLYLLEELGAADFNGGGMILTVATSTLGAGTFGTNLLTDDWTGTGFGDVFVPIPAAVWLFGSGLIALFGLGRSRTQKDTTL